MKLLKIVFVFLILIISLLLGLSTFEVIPNDVLTESIKKWVVIGLILLSAFSLIGLVLGEKKEDPPSSDKSNSGPKF